MALDIYSDWSIVNEPTLKGVDLKKSKFAPKNEEFEEFLKANQDVIMECESEDSQQNALLEDNDSANSSKH